jgi:hypothetical protein
MLRNAFSWVPAWARLLLEFGAGIGAWLAGFEAVKYWLEGVNSRAIAAQIYVVLTAALLLALLAYRELVTSRKEKYANITRYTNRIAELVKEIHTYIEEHKPADTASVSEFESFFEICKTKFAHVLDQLNLIFVSLTGTSCRTSIKLIYHIENEAYYYTLVRDEGSSSTCVEMDNRRVEQNHDPLIKNPPFLKLFDNTNSTWHYFSNNLLKDGSFESTSFRAYNPSWGDRLPQKSSILRPFKDFWPLPYRSTIACAVRHGPAPFLTGQKSIVLGFVTVDSESRRVFESRWDVPLVFSVADGLYHPLKAFLEIQNRVKMAPGLGHKRVSGTTHVPSALSLPPPG